MPVLVLGYALLKSSKQSDVRFWLVWWKNASISTEITFTYLFYANQLNSYNIGTLNLVFTIECEIKREEILPGHTIF